MSPRQRKNAWRIQQVFQIPPLWAGLNVAHAQSLNPLKLRANLTKFSYEETCDADELPESLLGRYHGYG